MCAARVITDRISGYSRGFGFVKYATVEEAGEGIKGMDGKVSASIYQSSTQHGRSTIIHRVGNW